MKRSAPLILFIIFNLIPGLKAQVEFSDKEKSIIYTNAVKVLEDYQTTINQMGEYVISDIEKAKSSAEAFLELFVNRQVFIYNDLDPTNKQTQKLSEFYEAETYSNSIILWYPDGITINLDLTNAKVSNIMSHENNIYSIDILAKKSINGNFQNQTLNQNVEDLTFRIAFSMENKTLGDFRIVGIRSAASNTVVDYSQALKEVNAEDLNDVDLAKIQSEIKAILQDYTNFLSLIGDPQEPAEDKEFYKESFLKLFPANDTRVYNDISPEPETSLISVADYLTSYIADYPNGIKNLSINADSAKFGKVIKADDGSFFTYTNANKFFSGSYKGKDAFRKPFALIFKISFKSVEKTFSDFRISSIDISAVDFYEATPGAAGAGELPQIVIKPVTRKGFVISLIGSFGLTNITNKNIESLTLPKDSVSWNTSPLSGYITALGVSYYFNDNISVRSGLEFNTYSAKYDLSGKFGNKILTADINSDQFYKKIVADYDSTVTINYLTLPILAGYTSGKPGKFGFFAEGGIKISIPQKASYKTSGKYKYWGYYPDNPTVLQRMDPEIMDPDNTGTLTPFGYYYKPDIDETNTVKIKGFNLAFYASAGINIPLGYYSSITFGPEAIIGLTDIGSDKGKYLDIFGTEHDHMPTKIKSFGFRISLAYKL
ncbi:MAG: outer membrane beta-barrel protein [Bacteroidia bacterium]|nr:outer membrane beta-barrel protein [Bacteroidia bacterium]